MPLKPPLHRRGRLLPEQGVAGARSGRLHAARPLHRGAGGRAGRRTTPSGSPPARPPDGASSRSTLTLRLMEPIEEMRMVFSPLLDRFYAGQDYRTRPVKISDSGRIRNELQTLALEAIEFTSGRPDAGPLRPDRRRGPARRQEAAHPRGARSGTRRTTRSGSAGSTSIEFRVQGSGFRVPSFPSHPELPRWTGEAGRELETRNPELPIQSSICSDARRARRSSGMREGRASPGRTCAIRVDASAASSPLPSTRYSNEY